MNGLAVMENVRRYRAIASLCRQAAAFRPIQRHSLLAQAEEWEHQAVSELEVYFRRSIAEASIAEQDPACRRGPRFSYQPCLAQIWPL
jgi:hypothetical protein